MKRNKVLMFLIIFSSLILGVIYFVPYSIGQVVDINYILEENLLYSDTNPSYDNQTNVRNQVNYTGVYNATYSHTYEIGDNGTDIEFVDGLHNTPTSLVVNLDNYDEVINLDTDTGWEGIYNTFSDQTIGSIEFWIRLKQNNLRNRWGVCREPFSTNGAIFEWESDGWLSYWNGAIFINIVQYSANVWYHVKVSFDIGADNFYIYFNGQQYGAYSLDGTTPNLNHLSFTPLATAGLYLDAIGYSWDTDYTINDNIIPYHFENSTTEIDKYEFFNNADGSATTDGQANIPFFIEVNGAYTFIAKNLPPFIDYTGTFIYTPDTTHRSIYRSADVQNTYVRNFYFNIWTTSTRIGVEKCYTLFDIDSYDDTLIVRLRLDDNSVQGDLKLSYYDGSSYIELEDIVDLNYQGSFNLTIVSNMVQLIVDETNFYYFPLIVSNKDGIGDVRVESWITGAEEFNWEFYIDSIGIYYNGISESKDWGNYYYSTGLDFNPKYQNLLYLNSTGLFALSMSSFETTPQSFQYFNVVNTSLITFMNTISNNSVLVENAFITISSQSSFNLNSIKIVGVQINDGSNEIIPTYNSGNINDNNSYWYISGVDTLSYILIANDSNLEFIEITFDIDNIVTYQRNLIYTGSHFNLFGRQLRLDYLDSTTSVINVSYGYRTERIYLESDKIFISMDLLITDDDLYNSYNSTGYFTNFILRTSLEHDISITTSTLLDVLTPLLFVIIFPSLLITYSFKKVVNDDDLRGKVLLPIIVVFSLVAFWFAQIDLWMLFLMIMGFGTLFYLQRD